MNNNNQPVYYNTWFIVIAFFMCWPIGVFLIIMRNNANKKNMFDGQMTEKFCYAVGGFLILAGLGAFSGSFFGGLFYLAGGAALIYYGKKNKEKVERYKEYINLIVNQNVTNLDSISRKINVDYNTVRMDIDTLISKGTFKNAVIDESSREIILREMPNANVPQSDIVGDIFGAITGVAGQLGAAAGVTGQSVGNASAMRGQEYAQASANTNVNFVAVKCPGCGATRRAIKGTGVECEYCGSLFNA